MGYYTLHKITIINKYNTLENLEKLCDVIYEVSHYDFSINEDDQYLIDSHWNCGYGCKWYSFDHDIYEISSILPKFKIKVEGKGEDGYTWERIVKNGDSDYENSDDDESQENEDSEDNEMNEDENDVDNIIEEEFEDINNNINDNEKFQR